METPIYLFTGLLESGKTTLIHEVVGEDDFLEPGPTVLIQCEEGETPFGQDFLKMYDIALLNVEDPDEFNAEFWEKIENDYAPTQIMIEYNGMWELDSLFESGIPEDWYIGGVYSTVNGATADIYSTNMRKMFMDPLRESNLIIFNRCSEEIDRQKYRRSFKALNPQVQVAFEKEDGTLFANEKNVMPFDYSGERVEIDDMDYGLWYLDAMENPGRYMGKIIHFTARYCASNEPGKKYFVPGRHIMTCCEDDIEFLGFLCNFTQDLDYNHGDWVTVDVEFDYGECAMYAPDGEGPILELVHIEDGKKPEQELVTFT